MLTDDDKQWMLAQFGSGEWMLAQFEREKDWVLAQLGSEREWMLAQLGSEREWMLAQFEREREWTLAQLERVETKLLTEFHKWASPLEMRVRSHSAAFRAMDIEVEAVADRVTKLRRHRVTGPSHAMPAKLVRRAQRQDSVSRGSVTHEAGSVGSRIALLV